MRVALVGLVGEGRPQISNKVSLLTHSQSSGISRCQPCCTRAESSALPSDAPAKLERQSGRKRVTPTMTRVFPSLSFASGWTIKDPVDMLTC